MLQQERPVEVPEVQYEETITQVLRPHTEFKEKQVPRIEFQVQERVVEVPQVLKEEVVVPVPEVIVAEAIRQMPEPIVQQTQKQIPKIVMEYKERTVEVAPQNFGGTVSGIDGIGVVPTTTYAGGISGTARGGGISTSLVGAMVMRVVSR